MQPCRFLSRTGPAILSRGLFWWLLAPLPALQKKKERRFLFFFILPPYFLSSLNTFHRWPSSKITTSINFFLTWKEIMFALACPGYWCAVCGRGCAGTDKVHRQRGCSRRLNPNTLRSRPWARWGDKVTHTVSHAVARSHCAQHSRSGSKHLEFCALLLKVVLLCLVLCLYRW